MTDRIINFLEGEGFKRWTVIFLAFSAGYFLHTILTVLWWTI